jgi:hypothetical protein
VIAVVLFVLALLDWRATTGNKVPVP